MSFASMFSQSLMEELNLIDKPGLVSPFSNGSHRDMQYETMRNSINVINVYMRKIERYIQSNSGSYDVETVGIIRGIGKEAETSMLACTGGVNTHRGAIFHGAVSISILTYLRQNNMELNFDNFVSCLLPWEVSYKEETAAEYILRKKALSHGDIVLLETGIMGAKGMLFSHYNIIRECMKYADKYRILGYLFLNAGDSNVVYRKGMNGLGILREAGYEILNSTNKKLGKKLQQEDRLFKKERISPGGSADLLGLAIFFKKIFKKEDILWA